MPSVSETSRDQYPAPSPASSAAWQQHNSACYHNSHPRLGSALEQVTSQSTSLDPQELPKPSSEGSSGSSPRLLIVEKSEISILFRNTYKRISLSEVSQSPLFTYEEKIAFGEASVYCEILVPQRIALPIQWGSAATWLDYAVRQVTVCAKKLTSFKRLQDEDQVLLLKDVVIDVMFVQSLYHFNSSNAIQWECVTVSSIAF